MSGYRLIVLAVLVAAGCGTSTPPVPPPPAPPVVAPAAASPPAKGDSATASSSPSSTAPATNPPPATGSPLRDLAARHLQSDGEGGWRVNEQAATDLEKLEDDAVVQLVPLLADPQVEVRRGAAFFLLGRFNPNDRASVAAFTKLLDDSDRTIRGIGLSALKQMSAADQAAAVPQLAAMLDPAREDKAENRASAARSLAALKSQGASVAGQLAGAAAGDPDPKVRTACLIAVAQIAPPEQAAGMLAPGLTDKEAAVRLVAAARLRQLGPAAAPVADKLAATLADADPRVADAAAQTLVSIGKSAVPALAPQLAAENVTARKLALAALAKIGSDAAEALPAVEKCLHDADPQVRELAAAALARIKPQ